MKRILLLTMLVLVARASVGQTDDATIYIYRSKNDGTLYVNYLIYMDGQAQCKLSKGRYIVLKRPPGEVKLLSIPSGAWKSNRRSEPLKLQLEAGKKYYIEADVKYNMIRYWMVLKEVTESTYISETRKHVLDNCQQ